MRLFQHIQVMKIVGLVVCVILQQVCAENCTTPNHEEAKCISLYTCSTLIQALAHQNKKAVDFVRQSHCGSWSSETQPLVCCGTKGYFDNTLKSSVANGTNADKPVLKQPISDRRFCGYQHTDDYFYTGNITAIDEFPWLAVLKYQRDLDLLDIDDGVEFYEFGCAGSLINDRYVLSAAQCIRLQTSSVVAVRLGEYNIKHDVDCVKFSDIDDCSNPVEDVGIEKKIKHPHYNRRHGVNDIALLRLNRSISYTDYIRPICLPLPGTKFATVGETMTLTGFGRVTTDGNWALIKKKILTRLISNAQCANDFGKVDLNFRSVTDNIMCANDLSSNIERSCEGDSGGPLMFSHRNQWHIEGIAVWSVTECNSTFPFAYTKVANYLNWIEQTVVP